MMEGLWMVTVKCAMCGRTVDVLLQDLSGPLPPCYHGFRTPKEAMQADAE